MFFMHFIIQNVFFPDLMYGYNIQLPKSYFQHYEKYRNFT